MHAPTTSSRKLELIFLYLCNPTHPYHSLRFFKTFLVDEKRDPRYRSPRSLDAFPKPPPRQLFTPSRHSQCSMKEACRAASALRSRRRSWSRVLFEVRDEAQQLSFSITNIELLLTITFRQRRGELDMGKRLASEWLGNGSSPFKSFLLICYLDIQSSRPKGRLAATRGGIH